MPLPSLSLYSTLFRHFSAAAAAAKLPKLPNLSKIPSKYRPRAIQEAQKALTDYLYTTRSLPFTFAEHITKNSLFSLSQLVAKVHFSPSTFSKSFQRFLRYHPINEFEFFYESIGINRDEISAYLPPKKFFLCDDSRVLDVACELSGFGFPWIWLGKLYREEISIFSENPVELSKKLNGFKDYGFSSVTIIGICVVFPYVLGGDPELGGEISLLFDDLRRMFIDFDLVSCVEGNVNAWIEVCRKIRVFYDMGCCKGKAGELMGRRNIIFIEYPEEVLVKKVEFFCRLSVNRSDIGPLLLERPVILDFDLENPVISVLGLLKHFGMSARELQSIAQEYPYVLGRNKMANLPHVMRALDLEEWFFNKIRTGNHHLLGTCVIGNPKEDWDKDYKGDLDIIQSSKTRIHMHSKLNFLHSIGYGENSITIKILGHLHGTSTQLQERFNCLLRNGIQFSKLCKMIRFSTKILNQNSEILEQKMKFLWGYIGSPLQCLDVFPAYLCYDLEKRVKPRYKFHKWLTQTGLCAKSYSIASMIATSEKNFIARIYGIHPAAPKQWLECFYNLSHPSNCQ